MCDGTGTPHPRTMFAVLGIGTFGAQKFILSEHQKVTESHVARTTMEWKVEGIHVCVVVRTYPCSQHTESYRKDTSSKV